jgi:hypothetical protein
MKILLATCAALLVCAAPAHAVIGGERVDESTVPWFAGVGGCGGTVVAPDRVVTAAHCVAGATLTDFNRFEPGSTARRVTGVSMAPGWARRNGRNFLDDVAIVRFDRPFEGVTPVPVGTAAGTPWILGHGISEAGADGLLRRAPLRVLSDAECARAYKEVRGNDGERFNAARMVCAGDVNGRAPLSSGCNGDSGGPLYAEGPVLLGIVSWGSVKCGADGTPSVFAQADRYRSFVADPDPVWAPQTYGSATVKRSKGRLRCSPPVYTERVDKLAYTWLDGGRTVGSGRTFRTSSRHRRATCRIEASNAGGFSTVLSARS